MKTIHLNRGGRYYNGSLRRVSLRKSSRIPTTFYADNPVKSQPSLFFPLMRCVVPLSEVRRVLSAKRGEDIVFDTYRHKGGGWYVHGTQRCALKDEYGIKIGCQRIDVAKVAELRKFIKGK